jgi:hypothetical protein
MVSDDRGQAYTLEGIVAAILVVSSLLLALQAVVVTPTTEGTADRDTMSQIDTQADDVLAAAHEDEALAEAALWHNASNGTVAGWDVGACPGGLSLCVMLEETFTNRSYRYNVYVDYRVEGGTDTNPLFNQGVPNSNAVTATHAVTLHGGMNLTGQYVPDESLSEFEGDFYAPATDAGGIDLYVLEIRVVVW